MAGKGLYGLAVRAGEAAINWYPGHMASATKAIRERIKVVDLVLEVRDARIPLSSANAELQDVLESKKRLIVLNKMDLANPNMMLRWEKHFEASRQRHVFVNAHQSKYVRKVGVLFSAIAQQTRRWGSINTSRSMSKRVNQMLDTAREYLKEKLAKEPTLLLMIVGIPNVGKSALINTLYRLSRTSTSEQEHMKKAKVGPLPGVTQDISGFKIGEKPSVYVLDTPGVLVPNINDIETGLKLCLTGAVKDSVVGEERVARYLLTMLSTRSAHLRWRADFEADSTSSLGANVRNAIAEACIKFDGNLEDKEDLETLVEAQMNVLRRLFKVPTTLGEAGWIRVSKQLLKLYRTGQLGRFTLDLAPSNNLNIIKCNVR